MLRSLLIACELGDSDKIPKIFLVDNSKQVGDFWVAIKNFMENEQQTGTRELFNENIVFFLEGHKDLYHDFPDELYKNFVTGVEYHNQNISLFFNELFDRYGYEKIRSIINHLSLIRQSWADRNTFVKIKNICTYLDINKIYMYPSNIVACTEEYPNEIFWGEAENTNHKELVLKNIEMFSPNLVIHTNFCMDHNTADEVFLLANEKPASSMFFKYDCSFGNEDAINSSENEDIADCSINLSSEFSHINM